MEGEVIAELPREVPDPLEADLRGVVEVVDHDGAVAPLEELQHGMAADVAGTAGDQNVPRQGRRRKHRVGQRSSEDGRRDRRDLESGTRSEEWGYGREGGRHEYPRKYSRSIRGTSRLVLTVKPYGSSLVNGGDKGAGASQLSSPRQDPAISATEDGRLFIGLQHGQNVSIHFHFNFNH
ncbi:hypothetical protein BHE74_00028940 [Ensete ventricosum]|nr:hypothetical protein BHE74_00028940 [Ensete ventricosum]